MSAGEALTDLQRRLEPYLLITELSWLPLAEVVTVGATVKAASFPAGAPTPAEMRAALFASAQEAIRVVEEAGYSHDEQPTIRIDGDEQERVDGTAMIQIRGSVGLMLRPPERNG